MASSSSFHKRARIKIGQIPGTRPSLYNNQLLISSGIPSLDNAIGGGIAVGTVLLVEEDVCGKFARIMLKYFIAEGVMTKQSIFLCSAEETPLKLVEKLPAPLEDNTVPSKTGTEATNSTLQNQEVNAGTDEMKIAWRYQNQPKVKGSAVSSLKFGHYYDLSKTMSETDLASADISYATSPVNGCGPERPVLPHLNVHYCRLLDEIRDKIEAGGLGTAQHAEKRNILRIGVQSIGSPLWEERDNPGSDGSADLSLFFIALRGILRSALAVAMITLPSHLFNDEVTVRQLGKLCDTVVKLDSISRSDREKIPAFKEYHGLFYVRQLPRLNSLVPANYETSDLAFKLRRKKFSIEKFHLPPELSDTASRSQGGGEGQGSSCSSSKSPITDW